jgi:hypothetical protein
VACLSGDFLIKVNELDDNMAERILTVFGRKQPVTSADHSAAKWLTLLVDSSAERRNLELFIDRIRCGKLSDVCHCVRSLFLSLSGQLLL